MHSYLLILFLIVTHNLHCHSLLIMILNFLCLSLLPKDCLISKTVVNCNLTNTHCINYPLINLSSLSNDLLLINIVNLCVLYYMWSTLLILADRSTFTCVLSCATIRNTNVWRLICVVKLSIMKLSDLITYWLYNYLLLLIHMKHANLGLQLMKYSITWYSIQNWLLSISLCLNTLLA